MVTVTLRLDVQSQFERSRLEKVRLFFLLAVVLLWYCRSCNVPHEPSVPYA